VWVLVQADIENTGVAFEAVLRPVPMVDVPVQNNDLFQPVFLLQITGGDRNVVEQTESKCDVTLGMMDSVCSTTLRSPPVICNRSTGWKRSLFWTGTSTMGTGRNTASKATPVFSTSACTNTHTILELALIPKPVSATGPVPH
jgi:hypothetical protein